MGQHEHSQYWAVLDSSRSVLVLDSKVPHSAQNISGLAWRVETRKAAMRLHRWFPSCLVLARALGNAGRGQLRSGLLRGSPKCDLVAWSNNSRRCRLSAV
jgi:hypothetical protein